MQYLKGKSYYNNLYDLHTIEECLDYYWAIKKGFEKKRNSKKFKKFSKKKFDKDVHKCVSYTVNIIKGERYRRKADTLKQWMDKDRKTQEKYDNATPPSNIYCKICYSPTKVISKDLHNEFKNDSRVIFMFECIKCQKRQAFFEDGAPWRYKPELCPKCQSPLKNKMRKTKDTLATIYSCSKCPYTDKDIYNFKKSREEWKAKEARDEKLLTEY